MYQLWLMIFDFLSSGYLPLHCIQAKVLGLCKYIIIDLLTHMLPLYHAYLGYELNVRAKIVKNHIEEFYLRPKNKCPFIIRTKCLEKYRKTYVQLTKTADLICNCVGSHTMFLVQGFLLSMFLINHFVKFYLPIIIFHNFFQKLIFFMFMFLILQDVQRINKAILKTLFEFLRKNLDDNLQYQVQHFIHQIEVSPIVLHADGYFTIGKAMVPAYLNYIVTYILLAIQIESTFV
ncbi:uncharacterized protein LOC142332741 [Lycorma delicatula]|uniref:uncharacterized protein LOC142332741 n=1 Tax=Lycorma delicatula TaxID=130591 RepID=UPI003F519662